MEGAAGFPSDDLDVALQGGSSEKARSHSPAEAEKTGSWLLSRTAPKFQEEIRQAVGIAAQAPPGS